MTRHHARSGQLGGLSPPIVLSPLVLGHSASSPSTDSTLRIVILFLSDDNMLPDSAGFFKHPQSASEMIHITFRLGVKYYRAMGDGQPQHQHTHIRTSLDLLIYEALIENPSRTVVCIVSIVQPRLSFQQPFSVQLQDRDSDWSSSFRCRNELKHASDRTCSMSLSPGPFTRMI